MLLSLPHYLRLYKVYPVVATVTDPSIPKPIPDNYAYDAPGVLVNDNSGKSVINVTEALTGRMFLMWQPSMPDAIAVTLGYVEWHASFGADLLGLKPSTFADGVAKPLFETGDYPTWTNVANNCHTQ